MPTVTVQDHGSFDAKGGRRLVLAIEEAGIDILHRCGGNARCTTCRVEVLDGEPSPMTEAEAARLESISNRLETTRLSCQIQVISDLTVEVKNLLHNMPDMSDPGPTPIEWPTDRPLPPEE